MPIFQRKAQASETRSDAYQLPPFLRTLWVSNAARAVWLPRLEKIRAVSQQLEFDAVVAGILPAMLRWIATEEFESTSAVCSQHNLKILPLSIERRTSPQISAMGHTPVGIYMYAAIGKKKPAKLLARAWEKSHHKEISLRLGCPECCSRFYAEAHHDSSNPELLWLAANNTATPASSIVELQAPPELNVFWRQMGASLLPHIPCNYSCGESLSLARRLADIAMQSTYADDFSLLQEVLRWPVEWSTLHGIAEMKTPVFKMCTNATPAASKRVVRWHGESYPTEGAKGIAFPYRQQLNPAARRFTEGLAVISPAK